jgi:hypothetical protein
LILILHVVTPSYLGSLSVGLNAALIYLRRISEEFWALERWRKLCRYSM